MNRKDRRAQASRERKADYESAEFASLKRTKQSMQIGKERSPDRVPDSPCGHCGKVLEGASSGVRTARPGDVSVCIYCSGANLFGEDMQLRSLGEEEVEAHPLRDSIRRHQELLLPTMAKTYMGQKKGIIGDA